MIEKQPQKRLFFGLEVDAPWPEKLPQGRLLDTAHRHITLAFLGEVDFPKLEPLLQSAFPKPNFQVGLVGCFDDVLFLPPRHPHVAAWHVLWLDDQKELACYQKNCSEWLMRQGFDPHMRGEFLPHVTICRSPFEKKQWEKAFKPLPMFISNIHLYESLGGLKYEPLWSFPLKPPFMEIDHTADIGFRIFGENLTQIFRHAKIALAFAFPALLPYIKKEDQIENFENVIIALNQIVSKADGEIGCPFKAVSFHGDLKEIENKILEWEMIIDV